MAYVLLFTFLVLGSDAFAVCAKVKIQIEQELTFERQAFVAKLTITNGLPDKGLVNFTVVPTFLNSSREAVASTDDPNNQDQSNLFFFRSEPLGAVVPDTIAANGTTTVSWLIVPSRQASNANPKGELYYVGANIEYEVDGQKEVVNIEPDFIYVKPVPFLKLEYFLPEQVIGDNPHTTFIESPVPFYLGVRVVNAGFGTAKALKIQSSQPKIVENEQQLLIDFHIEGSEVNGRPAQPTLLADFGDIEPTRVGIGRWIMTASLTGLFTEFAASFRHADEFGGAVTSLMDGDIATYDLLGNVLVDITGRDQVRDFLARRRGETGLLLFESDSAEPSSVANISDDGNTWQIPSAPGLCSLVLRPDYSTHGFFYVRKPVNGELTVTKVTRSDGKTLSTHNAWVSQTQAINDGARTFYFNLFDAQCPPACSYVVEFGLPVAGNRSPTLMAPGNRVMKAGTAYAYQIRASDPEGDPITLTSGSLPAGASFVDNGGGVGLFSWTPLAKGSYAVSFRASDGKLQDRKTMNITVTDDSLLDGWKERYWPGVADPEISGNLKDPDRDGLNNLVEYALGLDPTVAQLEVTEIGTADVEGHQYLTLTYVRRTDDPRLSFRVMGGNTLSTPETWEPQTLTMEVDQAGVQEAFERVKVRDSVALDDPSAPARRFLRLRVDYLGSPSELTVAAGAEPRQSLIEWVDRSGNETAFELERATDSGFTQGKTVFIVPAGTRTYQDSDLDLGITYFYRVRAVLGTEYSGYSNTAQRAATGS